MKARGFAAVAVMAGLSLAAGGCSLARGPSAEVTGARVASATDEGVVVEFTVTARNDGPDPLPMREVRYTVTLDGAPAFSGTRSAEATIPAGGEWTLRIPAAFRSPGAAAAGRAYLISGTIAYVGPGTLSRILFDTEVFQPSASFSGSGAVAGGSAE